MTEHAAPLPDQAARNLIVSRLDLNLLVEAGAGSGKTHSLAERMAAGIVSGRYQVGHMAAVTFTRKAAAELRGRFQIALERRLITEADKDARRRIHQALADLERLFAGTIHSFCAHLLRERPVEARLAPGFTELDEMDDARTRQRAWRDFLARERARESPSLRELTDAGVRAADLDAAFNVVCTFEEVTFPPGDATQPDLKAAWKAVDRFWKKLAAYLPDPVPSDTTCEVQQRARQCRWLIRVARRDRPADLVRVLASWEKENFKFTQKCWHTDPAEKRRIQDEVMGVVADFRASVVVPFLQQWRQYLYRLAIPLLVEARAFARDGRLDTLALNYNDLLQRAADLLAGNVEVRRALQQKYRWLFVDEFQDTDPIQADVIMLLASEPGPADGAPAPTSCPGRLREGALFIVGDPKQSIYRFRRADIQIYNRVRSTIEQSGGKIVSLTTTFRALPELCAWANDVFEPVFPPTATECQPRFQPLRPVREYPKAGSRRDTGVRTLTLPREVKKKEEIVTADATAIARYIRTEIDAGRRSAGDFLVLTWVKVNLGKYAAALEDQQVPIEVSGAGAFVDSQEVATLAALLRTLADPDDAVALVGVLRGRLFGISDEEMYDHKCAGGRFVPTDSGAGHPRVAAALAALNGMRELTRELPLAASVERVLQTTGLLALAAAQKPGGADAGDLVKAVNLLRGVMTDGGTIADAADALDEATESPEIEATALEPGRRDVVRVMNLHKAKGLEAAVVFLADPGGGGRHDATLRIVRDGPQALGYFKIIAKDPDKWQERLIAEPPDWDGHQAAEQPFLEAEQDRLRYVAATRARDLLVVSCFPGETLAERPWAPFVPHLGEAGELDVPAKIAARKSEKQDLSAATRAKLAAAREVRHAAACAESFAVQAVTIDTHVEIERPDDERTRFVRNAASGADWGTLIHALLEHAMRDRAATRADIERLARWLTIDNSDLRAVVPEALDTVEAVRRSDVWRRALAAEECHVEVPIGLSTPTVRSREVIVVGRIDLVFRTADGWHIVDYKTDQAIPGGAPALLARYDAQLAAYAAAWTGITSSSRVKTGVLAVREGATAWRP